MNKMPSKTIIETDLENTRIEIEAYRKLIEGYRALQGLHENDYNHYRIMVAKYEDALDGCQDFYEKLFALYEETYGDKK